MRSIQSTRLDSLYLDGDFLFGSFVDYGQWFRVLFRGVAHRRVLAAIQMVLANDCAIWRNGNRNKAKAIAFGGESDKGTSCHPVIWLRAEISGKVFIHKMGKKTFKRTFMICFMLFCLPFRIYNAIEENSTAFFIVRSTNYYNQLRCMLQQGIYMVFYTYLFLFSLNVFYLYLIFLISHSNNLDVTNGTVSLTSIRP